MKFIPIKKINAFNPDKENDYLLEEKSIIAMVKRKSDFFKNYDSLNGLLYHDPESKDLVNFFPSEEIKLDIPLFHLNSVKDIRYIDVYLNINQIRLIHQKDDFLELRCFNDQQTVFSHCGKIEDFSSINFIAFNETYINPNRINSIRIDNYKFFDSNMKEKIVETKCIIMDNGVFYTLIEENIFC